MHLSYIVSQTSKLTELGTQNGGTSYVPVYHGHFSVHKIIMLAIKCSHVQEKKLPKRRGIFQPFSTTKIHFLFCLHLWPFSCEREISFFLCVCLGNVRERVYTSTKHRDYKHLNLHLFSFFCLGAFLYVQFLQCCFHLLSSWKTKASSKPRLISAKPEEGRHTLFKITPSSLFSAVTVTSFAPF